MCIFGVWFSARAIISQMEREFLLAEDDKNSQGRIIIIIVSNDETTTNHDPFLVK